MNNLIINGIDHSKVDLEWAKLGGAVAEHIESPLIKEIRIGRLDWFDLPNPEDETLHIKFYEYDTGEFIEIKNLRMATPEECAAAGVEYIEPPEAFRSIKNKPKSTGQYLCFGTHGYEFSNFGYSLDDDSIGFEEHITHWMPLPQPPKDRDE